MRDVHTEAGAGLRCSVQLFRTTSSSTTTTTTKHAPAGAPDGVSGASGVAGPSGATGLSEDALIDRITMTTGDAQHFREGLDKCGTYEVLIGIHPIHINSTIQTTYFYGHPRVDRLKCSILPYYLYKKAPSISNLRLLKHRMIYKSTHKKECYLETF